MSRLIKFLIVLIIIACVTIPTYSQGCTICHRVVGGEELMEPQSLSTITSGFVTLQSAVSNISLAGLILKRRLFNGFLSGPTLRIKKGYISLEIVNGLSNKSSETNINHIALSLQQTPYAKTSEILICDPTVASNYDATNCDLIPPQCNCSLTIEHVDITNHIGSIGGTSLYRSQPDRISQFQVESGLAGMLIVEDCASLGICNLTEKILLFQPLMYSNTSSSSFSNLQIEVDDDKENRLTSEQAKWMENPSNGINFMAVNGQIKPTVSIQAGSCTRLRMGNAAAVDALMLSLDTTACDVLEIARDGFYLPYPERINSTNNLLLPGGTLDWLISCKIPGVFELGSHFDNYHAWDFPIFEGLILNFNVTGTAPGGCQNITLVSPETVNITDNQTYSIEVGGQGINRHLFGNGSSGMMTSQYQQRWHITNVNPIQAMPVVMSRGHFQVLSYNEYTGPIYQQSNNNGFLVNSTGCLCYYQFSGYNASSFPSSSSTFSCNITGFNHVQEWRKQNFGYYKANQLVGIILVPPLGNITVVASFPSFPVQAFRSGSSNDLVSLIQNNILSLSDRGAIMTYNISQGFQLFEPYPGSCQRCSSILNGIPVEPNCNMTVQALFSCKQMCYMNGSMKSIISKVNDTENTSVMGDNTVQDCSYIEIFVSILLIGWLINVTVIAVCERKSKRQHRSNIAGGT